MDRLRDQEMVRLASVGGTMLLVRADLHRDGLVFPPYLYGHAHADVRPGREGEIETEGLGLMATDMGLEAWGLPNLEIRHLPF
jgi:peptide chain release factor subunit 1